MRSFPAALERLSEQFARLPGIGSKTAQRLAFYMLGLPQEQAEEFAAHVLDASAGTVEVLEAGEQFKDVPWRPATGE